jgi:hypothetical protein
LELYLQNCNFSLVATLGSQLITLGKILLFLFVLGFYRYLQNNSNFSAKNSEKYEFRRYIALLGASQMDKSQFHLKRVFLFIRDGGIGGFGPYRPAGTMRKSLPR